MLLSMNVFMSTGRRRELGYRLRALRESCGHNGNDMAALLDWHPSMVSRAETGKRTMSTLEVATYTGACHVTGSLQQELIDLACEPDDYRLKNHPGRLADSLRTLIFCESTAAAIDLYEPIFIPGILQTQDYARALFEEGGNVEPDEIEASVQVRMARRAVLTRINPAQCTVYVHENALRSGIGGPKVMNDQLLHLLFADGRPQCDIRVIPTSTAGRGLANGAFSVFSYTDGHPVVYVQHVTTCEFLENSDDLVVYRNLLKRLTTVALDEARSREFILWLASDYDRQQGAARHADGVAKE